MASSILIHLVLFLFLSLSLSLNSQAQVLNPVQAIPIAIASTPSSNAPTPTQSSQPSNSPDPSIPPSSPTNTPSSPTNLPSSPTATNSASPNPSPPPSPTNSDSASPSASPAPTKSASQSAAQSSPTGSSSPQQSSTVVVITLTRTAADGSLYASLSSTITPLPHSTSTPGSSGSSSSSSNTWAIIGGIVGGLAALGAVVFIVFRCTQRRFSDLDDEDVAIKWPELVNRADDPSTLNPLAARPGLGHGVGDDEEHDDEKPRLYPHDIALESITSDQRHPGMYDPYAAYHAPPPHPQEQGAYYDPYLGPSLTQPPYPGTMANLGYDEMAGGYPTTAGGLVANSTISSTQTSNSTTNPISNNHHQPNHEPQSRPSFTSSHLPLTDLGSPSLIRQRSQFQHQHQQYPISWDGPEDIPLAVVNSSSNPPSVHNPQNDSHHHS